MRIIRLLIMIVITAALTTPANAQSRRLNPQDPLDVAVYCAGNNIDIYHIDASGQGQPALFASAGEVEAALVAAFNSGSAVTVRSGGFNTTLTALPGVRLEVRQSREGRAPYTYTFGGDTCAPVNLSASVPPPVAASSGAGTAGTVSGATTPTSSATTGSITYTVRGGDSFYRIARRFNISVNELTAANGTILTDIIYPGQTLTIPNQVVQPAAPAAAPAAAPGVPQLVVDASGNYLQDPSFEGIYTGRGFPDLNIPGPWGLQVFTSPRQFDWQNLRPYAFPRRDPPIHSGGFSLNVNRGYATFSVVLFQRVSVPENADLEAGAWAFYDTCDANRASCDNSGNPNFRVGIDPNGGTNPFEGDVVWSPFIAPQGTWGVSNVNARAQGSVVTMYISASQERPRAINELFIDDAWLRVR